MTFPWWRQRLKFSFSENNLINQTDFYYICINKIDATFQKFEHVIDGSSKLNSIGKGGSGTVLLECSNDTDVGTITKNLVQSLTNAGFPCEIESISEEE